MRIKQDISTLLFECRKRRVTPTGFANLEWRRTFPNLTGWANF